MNMDSLIPMGKSVIKDSDYRNLRIFTLRCIGQNLTPVSIKLKPNHKVSTSARKITEKAERQFMQDRVKRYQQGNRSQRQQQGQQ